MSKVMEVVKEYLLSHGESIEDLTEEEAIEVIVDGGNEVWADSHLDTHRWYSCQEVVYQLGSKFIAFQIYIITGDCGMRDMDLEYSIEDFSVVEAKTRTVVETYYE